MAGKHKRSDSSTAHALLLFTCSGLEQCLVQYDPPPQALSLLEQLGEVCPLQQISDFSYGECKYSPETNKYGPTVHDMTELMQMGVIKTLKAAIAAAAIDVPIASQGFAERLR